jgi:hypothetical protein
MIHGFARLALCAVLIAFGSTLRAQEGGTPQDHDELRAMLRTLKQAVTDQKPELIVPLMHKDAAITVLSQEVLTRAEDITTLFDKWFSAKGPIKTLVIEPNASIQSKIYDNRFGYDYGTSTDTFTLRDGRSLQFKTNWTASFIKDAGKWKLTTLHIGTDPMDNPVVAAAQRSVLTFGGGGAVAGLIIGFLIGRLRKRN